MSDLNQLYKKAVLAHNRNPQNYGEPDTWTHFSEGLNAICGDRVNVYLTIENDCIKAINYSGESCAISMASASMMTVLSKGLSISEWRDRFEQFKRLMDKNAQHQSFDELDQINTLVTVKKFPSRIKSATLCWYATDAAINGLDTATTE